MVAAISLLDRARDAVASVCDPEIPGLSIVDLGVLRDVVLVDGVVEARITPTYSGCPAMDMIARDIEVALLHAGIPNARVRRVLAPAWTTDWISPTGRAHLESLGIVPPPAAGARPALFALRAVRCPHCGSAQTETLAAFGTTACKSLHRCLDCREPFDAFKCH